MICCCAGLGSLAGRVAGSGFSAMEGPAKIELSVSRGTEFCEFCRRPSKEVNRKVLFFVIGKPRAPPYCWRLSEFLIGLPAESVLKLEKVGSGARAGLKANGSRASMALLRKNPKALACRLSVPDFDTMLIVAPLAPPMSAP